MGLNVTCIINNGVKLNFVGERDVSKMTRLEIIIKLMRLIDFHLAKNWKEEREKNSRNKSKFHHECLELGNKIK